MVKLVVDNYLPSLSQHAINNKVCLNPKNDLGEVIMCGNLVLNTMYTEVVTIDTIQISSLFRNKLSLKLGDSIEVTSIRKKNIQNIAYVTIEVEHSNDFSRNNDTTYYTEKILLLLITHLKGLVLTIGGCYFIPANGFSLKATVIELMVKNKDTLENVRSGIYLDPVVNIVSGLLAVIKNDYNPTIFKEDSLDFETLGIGGIDEQFKEIFRCAFASRSLHPDQLKRLGIKHQKGIILYGPPGTGKTTLARALCKMLNSHQPIVVNGPEILNKFVGASEENIRMLFRPAEIEYKEKGDYSQLHVIIFDEFDAICRQRTTTSDGSGNNVGNTIVNQLLSKIDGVDSLNNILLIGMTNRIDMIDDAILRPGRFGIHLKLELPNNTGRLQILKIHTKSLRENKLLHSNVSLEAYSELTENYSGAELELLVQEATSYLISRQLDLKNLKSIDYLSGQVTSEDFENAFTKIIPKFGCDRSEFIIPDSVVEYDSYNKIRNELSELIHKLKRSKHINFIKVLLVGENGVGKTTIASSIVGYPFAKCIRSDKLLKHKVDYAKAAAIHETFMNSYKSCHSYIMIDDLERVIEFMTLGPRYSINILQTLLVLLSTSPPKGCKLFVVATTSNLDIMNSLNMTHVFDRVITIPKLDQSDLKHFNLTHPSDDHISIRNVLFDMS